METIFFWHHNDPITGRRRRTRYRLTEAEAQVRLIDPVRIDDGALAVEPAATTPSGVWRSGLVAPERDEDGTTGAH